MFPFYSCRFVFGGDHGKFKFELPDGHSPAIEALLPKEKLKLDQCFWFGDIHRNVIHGPMEIEYTPYVPKPVDTANVSCISLERIITVNCSNLNFSAFYEKFNS